MNNKLFFNENDIFSVKFYLSITIIIFCFVTYLIKSENLFWLIIIAIGWIFLIRDIIKVFSSQDVNIVENELCIYGSKGVVHIDLKDIKNIHTNKAIFATRFYRNPKECVVFLTINLNTSTIYGKEIKCMTGCKAILFMSHLKEIEDIRKLISNAKNTTLNNEVKT